MRKIFLSFIFILFLITMIFPHKLWMYTNNFHPLGKMQIKLFICSGHNFPNSNFKIKRSLIKDVFISTSSKKFDLPIKSAEKRWESIFSLEKKATYIATFTLVKIGKSEPFFWGRAIIEPDGTKEKEPVYITGKGLEIIPLENISNLNRKDNTLKLKALFNGSPVKFNGKASVNGGKNIFLSSDKTGIVTLKGIQHGTYLITTNFKGKGCSLTFEVK